MGMMQPDPAMSPGADGAAGIPPPPPSPAAPVNPMRDVMRKQLIMSLMQRGMGGAQPLQGASTLANGAMQGMMMRRP